MNILGIDPSTTSLGWAFNPVYCGALTAKGDRPTRFCKMWHGLVPLINLNRPDLIVYYRPFQRGDDATRCGWGVVGIIEALANNADAAVCDVDEGTVRSHFGIKSNAPKADRRADLKAQALVVAQSLGYDGNHEDVADAILLVEYTRLNASRGKK